MEQKKYPQRLPDIIVNPACNNFTVIPNDIIRNPCISWKAKGILVLLLSNKNNEWYSYKKTMMKFSIDGEMSTDSGIKELEINGYLIRLKYRDKIKKCIRGSIWICTSIPNQFSWRNAQKKLKQFGLEFVSKKNPELENLNIEKLETIKPTSKETHLQGNPEARFSPSNNINYKNNINKKILSKDNIDCKSNLANNFSDSHFNKDSLTKKIKQSLSKPEDYSRQVQELFYFWQDLKIVNHKKSKTRDKALQKLDRYIQRYSIQEIKNSMQSYKNLLENPYNKMRKDPPYKVGLNQFFEFDKFTKNNIKNFHKDLQGMKSWFDLCLHDEEAVQKKFTRKTKDKNPTLTKKLTEVMQRKNGRAKLTDDQLDMCRKASNRILDLWTKKYKNKKDFNLMAKKYVMSFYRGYVLPWIEDTANKNAEKNFGVHWLLSEHFEGSIEEYIKNPYNS